MKVTFKDRKLGKIINDKRKLVAKHGPANAKLLIQRLDELKAIENFEMLIKFKIGRCHSLKGNLKGKYGMDLDHPDRLIIEPDISPDIDMSRLNLSEVKEVIVWEVRDYHG